MNSTVQDSPLSITELFRHGAQVYPDSEIITFEGEQARAHQLRQGRGAREPARQQYDESSGTRHKGQQAAPSAPGRERRSCRRLRHPPAWHRCHRRPHHRAAEPTFSF